MIKTKNGKAKLPDFQEERQMKEQFSKIKNLFLSETSYKHVSKSTSLLTKFKPLHQRPEKIEVMKKHLDLEFLNRRPTIPVKASFQKEYLYTTE